MEKKKVILSGPMFSPASDDCCESTMCEHIYNKTKNCFSPKSGGHYNHYHVMPTKGIEHLRRIFIDNKADEYNLVLFSTSGVHGTYSTIEDAEKYLKTTPADRDEDCYTSEITFVVIQPRLCTIHWGNCYPKNLEDIEFLKNIRQSSWEEFQKIGR